MEFVEVACFCKYCGEMFTRQRECRDEIEAERMRLWARDYSGMCPKCYKANEEQKAMARAAKLNLPIIIGRTTKQIKFAFTLRDQYITSHKDAIQYAINKLQDINPEEVEKVSAEMGVDKDSCVELAFRKMGRYAEYICLTESDASLIIEALKSQA